MRLLLASPLARWCCRHRRPARRRSSPPPAISRSRPWSAGSRIPGRSRSCRTAACWSPSGPAGCGSQRRDGKLSPPLAGVPRVFASGQGGLHDVVARPQLRAEPHHLFLLRRAGRRRRAHRDGARAARRRAALDDVKVIFRQEGPLSSGNHFGCRIVQTPDGNLFLTLGEHFGHRDEAQNLGNHLGKIVRIAPDGTVPQDNPFVGRAGAKPEIWSYGHRNPQGAALHPTTGKLWEHEHGPRGGDEVNIIEKGKNYGWPVIGYGIDYSGAKIHESTQQARHGAAGEILGALDRAVRHGVLPGRPVPGLARQPVRRRARRPDAGAAHARRREGHRRGAPAARPARAHPRRARGPGRRALSRHRQFRRPHRCASRRAK